MHRVFARYPPFFSRMRLAIACVGGVLCLAAILSWVVFPLPHDKLTRAHGTFVYSRDGHLLNCFTAPDRFWRMPVTLSQISPVLVNSVLANEDRWFYWHPGFNPVSLVTAAYDNMTAGTFVRGGSTLTMQIARMMEPKPRTISSKLLEILRAIQLEISYSKDELLEIYFNLAPYGGNIEGVGAASYLYFGKRPDQLSISEAAVLTAIPASPNQFRPDADPKACTLRRDRVLKRLRTLGEITQAEYEQSVREEIPTQRVQPPVAAPHLCQTLASMFTSRAEINATVDLKLQVTCEQLARNYQGGLSDKGINNLSVVVLDTKSGELLAMVGSADFGDIAHQGQINGALAPRSPGSSLKPFVYGLGFERGLISPELRVEDLPVNYAGYTPVNYDGQYGGVVSITEALIQSLNVPSVNLASRLGLGQVYGLLKQGGVSTLHRKYQEYGLPLVLGSCEVNLLELSNLYGALSRNGLYQSVKMVRDSAPAPSTRLLSEETCYLLAEILSELKRPDLPTSWEFTSDMPRVAWKTGTSYGRKDAWAIGYNPEYTVGVWAGNFTAEGSIAIVGAEISAPLMLSIFDYLYTHKPAPWFAQPTNIDIRHVCALTGRPANDACPETIQEQYVPGISPVEPCTVHRKILVDRAANCQLCVFCSDGKKRHERVIEEWPPKIATWLMRQGILSLQLPHNPECRGVNGGEEPVITSPEHDAVYMVQEHAPLEYQKILFEASIGSDSRQLHWFLDGRLFATSATDTRVFYTPVKGQHRLMCVDSEGRSSSVSFKVE